MWAVCLRRGWPGTGADRPPFLPGGTVMTFLVGFALAVMVSSGGCSSPGVVLAAPPVFSFPGGEGVSGAAPVPLAPAGPDGGFVSTPLPGEDGAFLHLEGVPLVNRFQDDGRYATWSLILRSAEGRAVLVYESGGNIDLLRRAHAAVEWARILSQAVSVEGALDPQGTLLLERLKVGERVFITNRGLEVLKSFGDGIDEEV